MCPLLEKNMKLQYRYDFGEKGVRKFLKAIIIIIILLGIGILAYIIRNIIVFYKRVSLGSATVLIDKLYIFGVATTLIVYVGYFLSVIFEFLTLMNNGSNAGDLLYFGFVFGVLGWSLEVLLQQGIVAINENHIYVYNKIFEYNKNSILGTKTSFLNRKIVIVKGNHENIKIRLNHENYNLLKKKFDEL